MKQPVIIADKKIIAASVGYFIIMAFFLWRNGPDTGGEAGKYIDAASAVINGTAFTNPDFQIYYFSYSLFVAFFMKLSISFYFLAAAQVVLSWSAAVCIFRILSERTEMKGTAFLGFLLYLGCYPIQKWNLFVYSEGLHTSCVVIGSYLFLKLLREKTMGAALRFLILLVLVLTTRPVGVIFLLSAFLAFIFYLFQQGKKSFAWSLLGLSAIAVIALLFSPFGYFINPDSLRRMEVICQVPAEGAKAQAYVEYNTGGVRGAFSVIKNEIGFGNFFRLGLLKIKSFFGLMRPYYSLRNNIFLSFFLLLYPVAIAGFLMRRKQSVLLQFLCAGMIVITSAGIFVACDDWSNRFVSPVFPFIIIAASLGVEAVRRKLK